MVGEATRNPYALFAHSLRERDWPLAAVIARCLGGEGRSRLELLSELRAARSFGGPAPRSLNELQQWAEMTNALGISARRE